MSDMTPDTSALEPPSYRLDGLTLRPAEDADLPALAHLWATAFPGERTAAQRLDGLTEGTDPFGGRETCWVGELEGRFVGGLRSYPLRMHLWGREFSVQGLAAVAVTPEARRQGVGGLLCRAALHGAHEAGVELSALFPYRVDFYRRLGYSLAGELHRYIAAPGEFPRFPGGREARVVEADEAMHLVPGFYEEVRPRVQGLIARSSRLWRFLEKPHHRVVVVPGEASHAAGSPGRIRGYLVARLEAGRTRERATLHVVESLVADLAAHRSLLGWLSLQRDQWGRVIYDALRGEHLEQLLNHPRRQGSRGARGGGLWFPSATLLRGPMLRIVNLEDVLRWAPLPAGATLPVHDPVLEANSGTWTRMGRRAAGSGVAERGSGGGGNGSGSATGSGNGTGSAGGGGGAHDGGGQGVGSGVGALPITLVTELFLDGALPGQREAVGDWVPLMGIHDIRLLDTF